MVFRVRESGVHVFKVKSRQCSGKRKVSGNVHGICHSEGATRSGLMAEKKIFSGAQLETMATEESRVASWQGEILRRPMIVCQTTDYGVGLLRMTEFNSRA
jgi:hypothetical protein